jgi:hypothetical protein
LLYEKLRFIVPNARKHWQGKVGNASITLARCCVEATGPAATPDAPFALAGCAKIMIAKDNPVGPARFPRFGPPERRFSEITRARKAPDAANCLFPKRIPDPKRGLPPRLRRSR